MRRTNAFTLVELLVVIAIIVILAGLLLAAIGGVWGSTDVSTAQGMVNDFYVALESYKMDKMSYPAQETDYKITETANTGIIYPDTDNATASANSIAEYYSFDHMFVNSSGVLVDPWDNPYRYVDTSTAGGGSVKTAFEGKTPSGSPTDMTKTLPTHQIWVYSAGQKNGSSSSPYFEDFEGDKRPIYKQKGR